LEKEEGGGGALRSAATRGETLGGGASRGGASSRQVRGRCQSRERLKGEFSPPLLLRHEAVWCRAIVKINFYSLTQAYLQHPPPKKKQFKKDVCSSHVNRNPPLMRHAVTFRGDGVVRRDGLTQRRGGGGVALAPRNGRQLGLGVPRGGSPPLGKLTDGFRARSEDSNRVPIKRKYFFIFFILITDCSNTMGELNGGILF
jgi:hypothetical protein